MQSPALALEFMEISGELLVSFPSGLCCLPPCRWCPLKLLIAKERAERRAAAPRGTGGGSGTGDGSGGDGGGGSGSTSTGVSRVRTTVAPRSNERLESITPRADTTATSERQKGPVSPTELALSSRPRWRTEPQVPEADGECGDAGLRGRQQELGSLSGWRGEADDEAMRAGRRSVRRTGDFGWKEEGRTGAAAEQGCTPPTGAAGVGNAYDPFRSNGFLAPREDGGAGDQNKPSILDRMRSKVLSMPGSPPPPSTRATEVRNGETCCRRDAKSVA